MVTAREVTLQELLGGSYQYTVPLYQRTYSWGRPQWQRLWEDVVDVADHRRDNPSATHFLGSLVLAGFRDNGPGGVQRWLVVDGQQRLTTLTLLLAAVRDHRAEHEGPMHADRVNERSTWSTSGRTAISGTRSCPPRPTVPPTAGGSSTPRTLPKAPGSAKPISSS